MKLYYDFDKITFIRPRPRCYQLRLASLRPQDLSLGFRYFFGKHSAATNKIKLTLSKYSNYWNNLTQCKPMKPAKLTAKSNSRSRSRTGKSAKRSPYIFMHSLQLATRRHTYAHATDFRTHILSDIYWQFRQFIVFPSYVNFICMYA